MSLVSSHTYTHTHTHKHTCTHTHACTHREVHKHAHTHTSANTQKSLIQMQGIATFCFHPYNYSLRLGIICKSQE